jgi:hypothetical protein
MLRLTTLAAAAVLGVAPIGGALAQSAVTMQPGQRLQLGPMMGERTVREVMVGPEGTVTLIFDMPQGSPQSKRALRVENVNGMLEVVYDTAAPTMPTATGGVPTLVQRGSGMYSVEYGGR